MGKWRKDMAFSPKARPCVDLRPIQLVEGIGMEAEDLSILQAGGAVWAETGARTVPNQASCAKTNEEQSQLKKLLICWFYKGINM
jgi:hypothetical protein